MDGLIGTDWEDSIRAFIFNNILYLSKLLIGIILKEWDSDEHSLSSGGSRAEPIPALPQAAPLSVSPPLFLAG